MIKFRRIMICTLAFFVIFCLCSCGAKCTVENCTSKAEGNTELCLFHTCEFDGCTYEKGTNSDDEYTKYCYEHGCYKCGGEKIDDTTFCVDHKCKTEGCAREAGYKENYCSDHDCEYDLYCLLPLVDGEKYCSKHLGAAKKDDTSSANLCSEYRCIYEAVEGSEYCREHKAVREGNIDPEIGMTYEQVLKSTWGSPTRKNVSENEWGISAQWVYENKGYIYFEDGVVVSIDKSY